MKIINLNRKNKVDNTRLLNTYIDWNKQYCYDLSRKITSLYDYMMWNYPEYFIFNAPNSLSGLDDFEPYKSLVDAEKEPRLVQPYEKHVAFNSDKPNLSIFFPSRLNYHQGFYNQSSYGDAILMIWANNSWEATYNKEYYNYIYYDFKDSNTSHDAEDTNLSNYNCYIYTDQRQQISSSILSSPGTNNYTFNIGFGVDVYSIKIALKVNNNWHTIDDNNLTHEYITIISGYYESITSGNYTITWEDAWPRGRSIQFEVLYKKTEEGDQWHKYSTKNLFSISNKIITYSGDKEALLIHKTYKILYGYTTLGYNSTQESLFNKLKLNKKLITMTQINNDDIYTKNEYEPDNYSLPIDDDVNIASYINFPSGYICILNKQPIGANNEQNSIKNSLSNYLIAPMGNGGYYDIWWNNNILQADYKANELNNFSSKLTINLAQNCRYINLSNDTFSFTGQQLNVTIPNWYIDNNEVKPQLSDKYDNIWTGQEDLVAQPYFNGEKMFTDIQYNLFKSVVKQQNVYNFNAHVNEPFSLTQVNLLIY